MEATGGMMISSSQVASRDHANLIQLPENERAKMMNATCGLTCLEQYRRFNHVSLWQKMFAASLIGMEGWSSMRCNLTWKLRATKSRRLYFLLQVSTPPTEGIGSGLLLTPTAAEAKNQSCSTQIYLQDQLRINNKLLLTPTTNETPQDTDKFKERMKKYPNGTTVPNLATQVANMLPTPNQRDWKGRTGSGWEQQASLPNALLPTLVKSDYQPRWKTENWSGTSDLSSVVNETLGTRSQLNPRFVAEMMGFPPDWLELPFLNTETNQ